MPCINIDKPLTVMLCNYDFNNVACFILSIIANIHASVLLNLLNSCEKAIKCLASLTFYLFSSTHFINVHL